jgi:hypothetical protein
MDAVAPISFLQIIFLILLFFALMAALIGSLIFFLRKRRSHAVTFDAIHISDLIKLIISIASFVTLCVTLILLVLQNRVIVAQTRYALQSVESNVFGVITTQSLNGDEVFVKHPELRAFFYSGKDLAPDDPLYHQVYAAAEYTLDYFDSLSTQLRRYPQVWRYERESWEKNIIHMFAWSPVLCRYLEKNKAWYNDDLISLMRAGEKQRQEGHGKQTLY